jgi:hypothetical protein
MTATIDYGSAALAASLRALAAVALAVGAALALMFAFAAALVVGLMVAGAAIAMRLLPRQGARADSDPETLEARRTPFGWEVETPRRKS